MACSACNAARTAIHTEFATLYRPEMRVLPGPYFQRSVFIRQNGTRLSGTFHGAPRRWHTRGWVSEDPHDLPLAHKEEFPPVQPKPGSCGPHHKYPIPEPNGVRATAVCDHQPTPNPFVVLQGEQIIDVWGASGLGWRPLQARLLNVLNDNNIMEGRDVVAGQGLCRKT